MLTQLSIQNFAIIDEISLMFNEGLTVLTGETGAGKSIIIDAVELLAGGRGSVDYVRHGSKKAEIEGLFTIEDKYHDIFNLAEQYGIDAEDEMFILRRTITNQGKSICRINGKLVTLAILREFGRTLIDIHSQHETQSLMDVNNHLTLLDHYYSSQIKDTKQQYLTLFDKYKHFKQSYEQLSTNEQQLAHRLDLLQFQMKELETAALQPNEDEQLDLVVMQQFQVVHLETAALQPNEDEQLEDERSYLLNFEKIYLGVQEAYNALHGENRGIDWLNKAQLALQEISEFNPELKGKAEQLSNSYYIVEELAFNLREFNESIHYDKHRLNEIEGRLDEISRLKKKYGSTVNDILEYMAKVEEEIEQITHKDYHMAKIEQKMLETAKDAYLEAKNLHDIRQVAAKRLIKEIKQELDDLYLENATFSIHFNEFPSIDRDDDFLSLNFQEHGLDHIEFLISTNIGEPEKPLHKIASGGELSRIMLAIKKILAKHQGVTSVIFDEVDTGVSGRVAQAMGEKIVQISTSSQVLCITHLPQVASMADAHLLITKSETDERMSTQVNELSKAEKIEELSRMMTGAELTKTALKHGQEMLDLATTFKKNI